MNKRFLFLILVTLSSFIAWSQPAPDPDGETCPTANPFCSDVSYNFPNSSGGATTAPTGPNYGCLSTRPNPIWYYMKIGTSGTLELTISQVDIYGFGIDIDFAMWGPFTDLASGCAQIMSGTIAPLQCSYSSLPIETVGLGLPGGAGTGASTPPAAVAGQYYIIILTNYENEPGNISFEQTAGTGATDCSIISCGLTLESSGPICQGDVVNLIATDVNDGEPDITVIYDWSGPGGFTSSVRNPSLTINTPGTHTFSCKTFVTYEDETDTCEAFIDVVVYPKYEFHDYAEVCAGQVYTYHGKVYTSTGTYTERYLAKDGCDSTYILHFTVNPMPDVRLNTSNPIVYVCEGEEAILGMMEPLQSNSYQWMKNDVVIPGAINNYYTATQAGTYKVAVVTDKGCIDTSRTIDIVINPAASVAINPLDVDPTKLCIGDTLTLSVNAKPDYEYRWSPQEFVRNTTGYRTSKIEAILLKPSYISVLAMNDYGCTASDSVWVAPIPCCDVLLPTAFSPNKDGLNDNFNILLQNGQKVAAFQIFDRYGKLVYDNNTPYTGWNGTYMDGTAAPQGVYFYRIVYTCTDNENYEKKGDIVLTR